MAKSIHDCVYYYVGGTERGEWKEATIGPQSIDVVIESIERSGYYAVPGKRSIGRPEGAPRKMLAGWPIPPGRERF